VHQKGCPGKKAIKQVSDSGQKLHFMPGRPRCHAISPAEIFQDISGISGIVARNAKLCCVKAICSTQIQLNTQM